MAQSQERWTNQTIDGVEHRLLTIEEWGEVALLAAEVQQLREENSLHENRAMTRDSLDRISGRQLIECSAMAESLELNVGVLRTELESSEDALSRLRIWSYVSWGLMAVGGIVMASVALSQ